MLRVHPNNPVALSLRDRLLDRISSETLETRQDLCVVIGGDGEGLGEHDGVDGAIEMVS